MTRTGRPESDEETWVSAWTRSWTRTPPWTVVTEMTEVMLMWSCLLEGLYLTRGDTIVYQTTFMYEQTAQEPGVLS